MMWIPCIAGFLLGAVMGSLVALRNGVMVQSDTLTIRAGSSHEALLLMDRLARIGTDAVQQQALAKGVAAQGQGQRAN